MRSIWKFPCPAGDVLNLTMPKGAVLLDVQGQYGVGALWAVVETDEEELETRSFRVFGTGHMIPDDVDLDRHVGTWQEGQGTLIWHLFEVT